MTQPPWITRTLSPADLAAIIQGGCASGSYMPAVTYHEAQATMNEYGDRVLGYLCNSCFEPFVLDLEHDSWAGFCCKVLSTAVEAFAHAHEHLANWDDDEPITDWD